MKNQRLWVDGVLKDADVAPAELAHHLKDRDNSEGGTYAWIDLTTDSVDELTELAGVLDLHDLAVEDALATHERQKVSRFDHHSLARVTNVVLDAANRARVAPLTVFITPYAVAGRPSSPYLRSSPAFSDRILPSSAPIRRGVHGSRWR